MSLPEIPPELYGSIPVAQPPPGAFANVHIDNERGHHFIVGESILLTIALLMFAIRCYTKVCVVKRLSWDDCQLRYAPS